MIPNSYKSISHIFECYGYYDYLDPDILNETRFDICNYLLSKKYSETDIKNYLNVNIVANRKKDKYKLIAFNIISALWMCDVFPKNLEVVMKNNIYETKDKVYTFDKKNYKLKVALK